MVSGEGKLTIYINCKFGISPNMQQRRKETFLGSFAAIFSKNLHLRRGRAFLDKKTLSSKITCTIVLDVGAVIGQGGG
jgi:hypothetical protein